MSGNKPTRMWHADKEGRCHRDCEAFSPGDDSFTGEPCDVLARLPWPRWHGVRVGDPCPFAVLGDVLCAVKTHEEKADEEHRCGTCAEHDVEVRQMSPWCRHAKDGPHWPNFRFWRKR